jgi:hypothetical protein
MARIGGFPVIMKIIEPTISNLVSGKANNGGGFKVNFPTFEGI